MDQLALELEWDFFKDPIVIQNPNIQLDPLKVNTITIKRDEDYSLISILEGDLQNINDIEILLKKYPGFFSVEFSDNLKFNYSFLDCFFKNASESSNLDQNKFTFKIVIGIEKVTIIRSESKVDTLKEWFLNGNDTGIIYYRKSDRTQKKTYLRKLNWEDYSICESTENSTLNYSTDFIVIDLETYSFIISKIPEHFGPQWSKNLGIEYRNKTGGIPDEKNRLSIQEICSFIFGKRLLKVGSTSYDSNNRPIKIIGISPGAFATIRRCQNGPRPPIQLTNIREMSHLERIFENLIPQYLNLRDELGLYESLWKYWICEESTLDSHISSMATGIEILSKKWFASKKSKMQGVYLPKERFDLLLKEELTTMKGKLKEIEFGEKIYNKISGAYQFSSNDLFNYFVEELGLEISDVEKEAHKFRNVTLHESIDYSDEMVDKIRRLTNAYRSFFNRLMLQLLGHTDTYIDYYIEGRPSKPLNCPVGIMPK